MQSGSSSNERQQTSRRTRQETGVRTAPQPLVSLKRPKPEPALQRQPRTCRPPPDQREAEYHWVFLKGEGFRVWQLISETWFPSDEALTVHEATQAGWVYVKPAEPPIPRDALVVPKGEALKVRALR